MTLTWQESTFAEQTSIMGTEYNTIMPATLNHWGIYTTGKGGNLVAMRERLAFRIGNRGVVSAIKKGGKYGDSFLIAWTVPSEQAEYIR